MDDEKVVTVTLPGGTRVSCREGLAARLSPQTKKAEPEGPAETKRPSRKPRAKVARGRVTVDDD